MGVVVPGSSSGMTMLKFVPLMLLCIAVAGSKLQKNSTKLPQRQGKVFSLFSIVQFPNEACSSTSGTYKNGTCLTAGECPSKSGSAQGNCAAGFGVCCVFSVSASGSSVSENCTYLVNPNFPSNYGTAGSLSYTIRKCSNDICRIRLDYESFVLDGPTTPDAANQATSGQCATDVMTIKTTDRTATPTIGAVGTYGYYPYLCGTNTGYHSYIDMSCTSTDTATLDFTLGNTATNQFNIKVTQYSCNDPGVASQQGCFQYHTGVTGTIQSYNFAGGRQLASQNYKNCIRQEEGYCCIQYTVIAYNMGGGEDDADMTCANNAANRCSGSSICFDDYIIIPQGGVSPTSPAGTVNYDRFCGFNLNAGGFPAVNQPIINCKCPFELSHITGITSLTGANNNPNQIGYQLSYSQIPGNC